MQPGELVQRLKEVPGLDPGIDAASFDPGDPLQVDELARRLLERFYGDDDPEAFKLLAEVTAPLLGQLARSLVDELSLAVAPSQLVARHMAGLFVDLRSRHPQQERFLAAAEQSMRAIAKGVLEDARAPRRHPGAAAQHPQAGAGGPSSGGASSAGAPGGGDPGVDGLAHAPLIPMPRLAATGHVAADAELARVVGLGLSFLTTVQAAFHALNETDRKLLLASEIRDLSYNRIAEELSIPVSQVGPLIRDARERFARRVAASFQRPSGQGGLP